MQEYVPVEEVQVDYGGIRYRDICHGLARSTYFHRCLDVSNISQFATLINELGVVVKYKAFSRSR